MSNPRQKPQGRKSQPRKFQWRKFQWRRWPARVEDGLSIAVISLMALLPLVEIAGRKWLGGGIPGSIPMVQHLTLWAALLGAALASRTQRHLALSTTNLLPPSWAGPIRILTSALAVAVTSSLVVASLDLVGIEREFGEVFAWGIPLWVALAVMPLSFTVITGRLIAHGSKTPRGRGLIALGLLVPLAFGWIPNLDELNLVMPLLGVILVGTVLGMPIFTAIGGAALLLFWGDGTPANAVPGETYRLSASPMLPVIPLFTLSGYILAEGGAVRRLMRLFQAWVGWMPGGLAIVTVLVLAFFTPLTGASGVTILTMGGLLLPVLLGAGYPEKTSMGLVTVSGSIGLLLPPSLPVILYGYYSNQPIERLFVGGLLPGLLLIIVVAGWGAFRGWQSGTERVPFRMGEALSALWEAKWELLLPVLVLGGIFGGFATLVEAAAMTVLYAFVIECIVFREVSITRQLPVVFIESATLVGGFMIILGVALGFTNYLVIAEVPAQALGWVQTHIESKLVFLLALNVLLIVVGALMDIYSAIIVIVPLVYPMAAVYGVDPVHLGVIFLANMELGYLMPPMGENLFLASFRFKQPLTRIYASTLPYVVLLLITVLVITYVPWLTLWLVEWSGV